MGSARQRQEDPHESTTDLPGRMAGGQPSCPAAVGKLRRLGGRLACILHESGLRAMQWW